VSEGIACYVYSSPAPDTTPLYRLFNPSSGDHFYTTSTAERDAVASSGDYVNEQIACYVYGSAASGTTDFYRLFSSDSGDHFYTTYGPERDAAMASAGYVSEGTACYVYGSAASGTTPLHRLWKAAPTDFSAAREDAVTQSGARRMWTDATYLPADQRLFAKTRTWNAVKLTGFTGGVAVLFLDQHGRAIGASSVHRFGVDGSWIGRSDRMDTWQEYIDPSLPWVPQIRGIDILHTHAGVNRLEDIIKEALEKAKAIGEILFGLESVKPAE
jgi:hypothetical protein